MEKQVEISNWIDNTISDLVSSEKKLSDTFLKVQVLAFKIQNPKLKEWVDKELNGYKETDNIPEYRNIPTAVFGNLIQDRGFGGAIYRRNERIPIEYQRKEIAEKLIERKLPIKLAELENMLNSENGFIMYLPDFFCQEFSKMYNNFWYVEAAWQRITKNSIEGLISAIKSHLLNFLLELNSEIGNNSNFSIMDSKKEINNLFDKTIGNIKGENINISFGNDNIHTVNKGDNSQSNIIKGDNNLQTIKSETKIKLDEFIQYYQENEDKLELKQEDKEDIRNEISRIETQIKRDNPKVNIISTALETIHGLLLGVAGNAYTPVVLDKLNQLMSML